MKFEDVLQAAEDNFPLSKKYSDKLLKCMEDDHVYRAIFESYISRRLKSNVHPERLLSLAYNLERFELTQELSEIINIRLADSMIKGENLDQFYFMNRHDTRVVRHVAITVFERMGEQLDTELLPVFEKMATHLNTDKYSLILKAMGTGELSYFRYIMFMDRLSIEDQYLLVVKSLAQDNPLFFKFIQRNNTKLLSYIGQSIADNGDKDIFATALRSTSIPIEDLESSNELTLLLDKYAHYLVGTLGRLYVRAEQAGRWEYLLLLGAHKNKKDVLKNICKAKDKNLIDRFFAIYKDCHEVKHLVPFL